MRRLLTARLVLRPIERADLGALSSWYADPDVMQGVTGHTLTRSETEAALDRYLDAAARDGYGLMMAELRADGEPVGRCGYWVWDIEGERLVEVGWLIAAEHQGRGYATEAGDALLRHARAELGLETLISVIQPDNGPSRRVAEKLGGEYWRDWVTPGGMDVVVYRYRQEHPELQPAG